MKKNNKGITADMLSRRISAIMESGKSDVEKSAILTANGVSQERDEPPLWHREGDAAWAIYLQDGKLHVERAKASEVAPELLV